MNNFFENNEKYKRLFECFIELAETDVQKDAIEQIMKNGEYNGFKLNSMLSNKQDSEKAEIKRRIAFSEIILHDESLFFYLANNGLNIFHGTGIDALQNILNSGLCSSSELSKRKIQLKTGEEQAMNNIPGFNVQKRNFISLTDDFDVSALYAGFNYEEQIEYAKMYYGKDLTSDEDIPIIICFNGNDIQQKYGKSLVYVKSEYNEIGISASINPIDIKCIITSYDKIEYVKSITSKYGINVLGYDFNDKYEKRIIYDKEGKFYSSNLEIDEHKFEKIKEKRKERKKNKNQNVEHLSDEMNIKMDILFNMIEQYNKDSTFGSLKTSDLITKYNLDKNVAQGLVFEINKMFESYKQEKQRQLENYVPYVLDISEEGANSINEKKR